MEFLVMTDPGCEEACAEETKHLLNVTANINKNVFFKAELEDACRFILKTQTALHVLLVIGKEFGKIQHANLLSGTFKAAGDDIEKTATWILDNTSMKVKLDNPDVTIHTSNNVTGIDLGGDLHKRDWRVMLSRRSLRATIAASAVIYAGVKPESIILDPFGDDGTLAIETELMRSGKSTRFHVSTFPFQKYCDVKREKKEKKTTPVTVFADNFRDLKAIKMNAKLAGIQLTSSKISVSWLDLKIEKDSIDIILTYPHTSGRVLTEKKAKEQLDIFFEQAKIVLKPEGTVTCITWKPGELPSANEERKIKMGKSELTILHYTKAHLLGM